MGVQLGGGLGQELPTLPPHLTPGEQAGHQSAGKGDDSTDTGEPDITGEQGRGKQKSGCKSQP
ncbi:MAG: hypothetical protein VB036_18490 [Propionicimonas sp.]|nr:hypothetical protein [Propionicimonas sp.]